MFRSLSPKRVVLSCEVVNQIFCQSTNKTNGILHQWISMSICCRSYRSCGNSQGLSWSNNHSKHLSGGWLVVAHVYHFCMPQNLCESIPLTTKSNWFLERSGSQPTQPVMLSTITNVNKVSTSQCSWPGTALESSLQNIRMTHHFAYRRCVKVMLGLFQLLRWISNGNGMGQLLTP